MKNQNYWLSNFYDNWNGYTDLWKDLPLTCYENLLSESPVITWEQTNRDITYWWVLQIFVGNTLRRGIGRVVCFSRMPCACYNIV